jgi:hypothetical protein
MISFKRTPEQIRKTVLMQKRLALVGATLLTCCFIVSLLMAVLSLIAGVREWGIVWLTLVVLCVPVLLVNSMLAVRYEFKGWKLANGISTKAEGGTFAAFRADNGLKKTLRFHQCGFKRGEE